MGTVGIEPRSQLWGGSDPSSLFSFGGFWRSRGRVHFLVTFILRNYDCESADDSSRLLELHFFSRAHLW